MNVYLTSFLSLILFLSNITNVSAQNKKLSALFSYATFSSPQEGSYIETYLLVNGASVQYKQLNSNVYQGVIEITMIFKQNDTVKTFEKYELKSPQIEDTLNLAFDFLDQQRFVLPNGVYDFELYIADKNAHEKPFFATDVVEINYIKDSLMISDIQFVKSVKQTETANILSKAGYDLIPQIVNYYPKTEEKLIFYTEVYNADKFFGESNPYVLTYYLETWENRVILSKYKRLKREISKNINVLLGEININDLPSGNYNLVVEVRNPENEVVAVKKNFFYRNNPDVTFKMDNIENQQIDMSFVSKITNKDTLRDYIRALYPISSQNERMYAGNIIRNHDFSAMQKFFYGFWYNRNMLQPETEWLKYFEDVKRVNAMYGTRIKKGYETDRGRVYLQYGKPNTITQSEYEPSAYPYEIWHYYTLGNQTNRRFVFYARELATNDYELIHSDALGEINDPRWQIKVHKRDTPTHSLDPENSERHWGGRLQDYYSNPR